MTATADAFQACGRCGTADIARDGPAIRCNDQGCGWTFFTNVAAAAAVLLMHEGRVLLVRRTRPPSAGKLGIPGGFVDPHETAEQAARRELREELRLELPAAALRFLCTAPNVYPYAGVTYHSLDTYFVADLPELPTWFDDTEIAGIELVDPTTVDSSDLAFDATRAALKALQSVQKSVAARGLPGSLLD
ncbi:MAG: NUDIX domain-containing protein [Planctomycetota bacterium]